MAAHSSPTNGSSTFFPLATDLRDFQESDMLNFSSDMTRAGPASIPSLDFGSSAYVESLTSTDGCSRSLNTASTTNRAMFARDQTWSTGQQAEQRACSAMTAGRGGSHAESTLRSSQHLPGCPSVGQLFQQQYDQVVPAPALVASHVSAPPPSPCSQHCVINAWQAAQRGSTGFTSYYPQIQSTYTHDQYQSARSVQIHQQGVSNPVTFGNQANCRLTPDSVADQRKTSISTGGYDLGVSRKGSRADPDPLKHFSYTSPAPSSIMPDSSSVTESELAPGRQSHYYHSAQPDESDGKYHCAFEDQEDCNHEPTKLKCNYDKYIDSHLKPYRCKFNDCEDLKFSSTACRLRHEREAHGLHGHGPKPYLCQYDGCQRSRPEHGFPRSWNRTDHMKRVHGHEASVASEEDDLPRDTTPAPAPAQPEAADLTPVGIKKRQNSVDGQSKANVKRQKASVVPAPTAKSVKRKSKTPENKSSVLADVDKQQKLHDEWRSRRSLLQQTVHQLQGPDDTANLKLLSSAVQALTDISHALVT